MNVSEKRKVFRALHERGCFVLPNPWDLGSTRVLESLGFKALATTSAGHAWSRGQTDGAVSRAATLAHMREIAAATQLPINADFGSGFGDNARSVAQSVHMAVETGVAGLSIEDSTADPNHPLRDLAEAVARVRAARAAIDDTGGDTLLIARAENFLVGRADLDDTILRLKAYSEAGADSLYAPGIRTADEIRAVVAAVAPKPVNLLIGAASEMSVQDVATLGVRRISVGGALARAAWGGFLRAARCLAEHGRFDGLADAPTFAQVDSLFRDAAP